MASADKSYDKIENKEFGVPTPVEDLQNETPKTTDPDNESQFAFKDGGINVYIS